MLILTRRTGESIMIGDLVEITILSHHKTPVRIGINAPQTVPVHRLEIYNKIRQQVMRLNTTDLHEDEEDIADK